jgi:hypothetical protein
MSDLRKQLQSLQTEYKSARYPGNLAEELLGSSQQHKWSRWRIGGYVTIATGIAAAILISLLHTPTITTPSPVPPTAVATTQPANETVMPVANLSPETFPDDIPLVPSGDSLVPTAEALDLGSMPAFPSVDFSSLSSTEEQS